MALKDIFKNLFKREVLIKQEEYEVERRLLEEAPRYAPLAYLQSSVISSCVDYIASSIANIPYEIVRLDGSKSNSSIAKLFEHPNESLTFLELMKYTIYDYYLFGYSFWIKDSPKKPSSIEIARAFDTQLNYDDENNLVSIVYKKTEYPVNYLVKFINCSPVNNLPESKIQPALAEHIGDWYLLRRMQELDKNGGIYHPIITPANQMLTEPTVKALKVELLNQLRSSPEVPIIFSAPVETINLATDSGRRFAEEREIYRKRIVNQIFGLIDLGTYSNAELVEATIFLGTIVNIARFIESRINKDLIQPYDKGLRFRFDIQKTDNYRKVISYVVRNLVVLLEKGVITVNELRQMLELDTIPDGDVRMLSSSIVPFKNDVETSKGLPSIFNKTIESLERSEKLDDFFNGKISFYDIKNYYTTLADIPALKRAIADLKGEAFAEEFENRFKQFFLSNLITSNGKNEFILKIKEFLNEYAGSFN